jgi:2-oxoglutarate ferredoxin oxidoreductase subunit beta
MQVVEQHDGSLLRLRKLAPDYDPCDKIAALQYIQAAEAAGEVATGLLYVEPMPKDLHENFNTVETPLNRLEAKDLCPGKATLDKINASLR